MDKIRLKVHSYADSFSSSSNYVVFLEEMEGLNRRLPIVISYLEAQSIAICLEGLTPSRPFTHDLMSSVLEALGVVIQEVIINDLKQGVYYSRVICIKENQVFNFDSRTSDALALAIRAGCPIYTYESVLKVAGMVMDKHQYEDKKEVAPTSTSPKINALASKSLEELTVLLNDALTNENYELAAQIRDELTKRSE